MKDINCCNDAHRQVICILMLPETMLHVAKTLFILLDGPHRSFSNVLEEEIGICLKDLDNPHLGNVKIVGFLL